MTKKKTKFPFSKLNENHQLLIGKIIAECGYLETVVQVLIWKLAKMDSAFGAAITAHMGLKDKLNAMKSISDFRFSDNEMDKKIKAISKEVEQISIERNYLVHNAWSPTGDDDLIQTSVIKARGKFIVDLKSIKTKDLENLRQRISNTTNDLYQIVGKLHRAE